MKSVPPPYRSPQDAMQGRVRSDHKRKGKSNRSGNYTIVRTPGADLLYCFQVYKPIVMGLWVYNSYLEMSLGVLGVNSDIRTSPLIWLHFWMSLKYIKVQMDFQKGALLTLKPTEVSQSVVLCFRGNRSQTFPHFLRKDSLSPFSNLGSYEGIPDLENKYLQVKFLAFESGNEPQHWVFPVCNGGDSSPGGGQLWGGSLQSMVQELAGISTSSLSQAGQTTHRQPM